VRKPRAQRGPVVRSARFVLGKRHSLRILAVVPVRYGATRFPGKPLADLGGRPIVQWVYEAASGCPAYDEVIVATDSEEIAVRAREFGAAVELTSDSHPSGTDRVAEVAERHPESDVVVNVQGDQPFATPKMLGALVEPYLAGEQPPMTTLACPLTGAAAWADPNVVKVVRDVDGYALYFSRSSIPHEAAEEGSHVRPLHHLGLYAFTRETVLRFPRLPPTPLEQQERLEQLRALEHGIRIRVCETERPVLEVNTPEDLEEARRQLRERAVPG
jgi:3-deoxy-manno-octulosonate cytidylyltransferase (CMP-KDO synthetase)